MHILNNGNGIASEFVWLINHSYWLIIIGVILIVLFFMLDESIDDKHSKLAFKEIIRLYFQ